MQLGIPFTLVLLTLIVITLSQSPSRVGQVAVANYLNIQTHVKVVMEVIQPFMRSVLGLKQLKPIAAMQKAISILALLRSKQRVLMVFSVVEPLQCRWLTKCRTILFTVLTGVTSLLSTKEVQYSNTQVH